MAVSADIEAFFRSYASAAEAMNAEALASLHHAPCLKVHGDGRVECLLTHDMVRAFFEELGGRYETRDHGESHFHDLQATALGSAAALASVTWEQFRKDGSMYRRFRRSYNLIRVGGDWKILAATAHRE